MTKHAMICIKVDNVAPGTSNSLTRWCQASFKADFYSTFEVIPTTNSTDFADFYFFKKLDDTIAFLYHCQEVFKKTPFVYSVV